MRTKSLSFVLGATLALAIVLFGWIRAANARRRDEASLGTLMAQRAAVQADIRRAEAATVAAEAKRAELAGKLDGLRATMPTASASSAQRIAAFTHAPTSQELIRADPKLEALFLASIRGGLLRDMGPLFQTLNLSPDQIDRIAAIIVKRETQRLDLSAIADTEDASGKAAAAKLQQQVSDEQNAALAELLGPEGYQKMQEYSRTSGARLLVTELAGNAAVDDCPLTGSQAEQLIQLLTRSGVRLPDSSKNEVLVVDWDAIDREARQILSPSQFALFRDANSAFFSSRWELGLRAAMARAQQADAANNPTPGGPK